MKLGLETVLLTGEESWHGEGFKSLLGDEVEQVGQFVGLERQGTGEFVC